MELALIPPFDLLEYVDKTKYQLMLPQLLNLSDRYKYVYRALCMDPTQYVILDNGAAEGDQVSDEYLIEVAKEYKPNEIVIPDIIGDMQETMDKCGIFVAKVMHHFPARSAPRLMYVIQGQTWAEFDESIAYALMNPMISTIAVPRHALKTLDNIFARRVLVEHVRTVSDKIRGAEPKPVHLLGGSPLAPTEIKAHKWPDYVRGHDTSAPFNYAYDNKRLRVGNNVSRPEMYFDLPVELFAEEVLEKNVRDLEKWAFDA